MLTRSGVVQSVHAFARSDIGKYFVSFMALGIAATIYLILDRLDYLKSESELESVVSRESSFLFNNLILLASCFAVLWGTLFPVISEAVTGEKISLDADWFNRLMVPIGLFLLLLTGWGRCLPGGGRRSRACGGISRWPGIASLVLVGALFAVGIRNFYALISFGFCLFVALTVIDGVLQGRDFHRRQEQHEPAARHGGADASQYAALRRLPGAHGNRADVHRLHRTGFQPGRNKEVNNGDTMQIGILPVEGGRYSNGRYASYSGTAPPWKFPRTASSGHARAGEALLHGQQAGTSEVAIRPRPNEDLYLNFGGMSDDNQRAIMQAYVLPLVSWIWIGGLVLIFGTLICLVPSKVKMKYPRTEVVGYQRNPCNGSKIV